MSASTAESQSWFCMCVMPKLNWTFEDVGCILPSWRKRVSEDSQSCTLSSVRTTKAAVTALPTTKQSTSRLNWRGAGGASSTTCCTRPFARPFEVDLPLRLPTPWAAEASSCRVCGRGLPEKPRCNQATTNKQKPTDGVYSNRSPTTVPTGKRMLLAGKKDTTKMASDIKPARRYRLGARKATVTAPKRPTYPAHVSNNRQSNGVVTDGIASME
mmetsp:Transcript_7280/g.20590  ORF Transcript_7280/g.20590 Transcript_7280/m.20590 type:complete len:214 (-) Transcript_7280:879-1520(-)